MKILEATYLTNFLFLLYYELVHLKSKRFKKLSKTHQIWFLTNKIIFNSIIYNGIIHISLS